MQKIKALVITFVICLETILLTAQTNSFELTFRARYYDQNVTTDSIKVINTSKDCDTIIYYPDTVLQINHLVGINNQVLQNNYISNSYPNPVYNGHTTIDFVAMNSGNITIQLVGLTSEVLVEYKNSINQGKINIELNNLKEGVYILLIKFLGRKYSKKVVCRNIGNGKNEIINIKAHFSHVSIDKNVNTQNSFWFEQGDTLLYIGYSITPNLIGASDVLESKPLTDTTITFEMLEGMPCYQIAAIKYFGHLYPTVQIGEQCWLKENLNIGKMINSDSTMTDNDIIEKYCYDNLSENCSIYGGLYQWGEMMQYDTTESAKGICPNGWHNASLSEWDILLEEYNGNNIKETGTYHWAFGNNGNNSSGFTSLPSGYKECCGSGEFKQLGTLSAYFTTTRLDPPYFGVWKKSFFYNGSIVGGGNVWETHGMAVRCIKDY